MSRTEQQAIWIRGSWAAAAILFYLPLLIPALAVIEPDDLLDSELVYNVAIGALWRGDVSIAHAFLVGHVALLALSRLTQPLMALYALLPPLQAYVLNDFIVRAVAALGSYLLLSELGVRGVLRHLAAALFAISLTNTAYGLTVAGLPAALWLLASNKPWRVPLLALIAWNSSLYLSGIFFLAAAGFFHRFVMRRPLDRSFALGLLAYAAGLAAGNAGLIWLVLSPHSLWHRAEWLPAPPSLPFPWKSVARPLLPLFALAAALAFRDRRARAATAFGLFILAWYALCHLPFAPNPFPFGLQADRFFFLWPLTLLLLIGVAASQSVGWQRRLLTASLVLACAIAATPHEHLRQLARDAVGHRGGYPPFHEYYRTAWFRSAKLDAPVMSVGLDPMVAPMNGVPSIDGYFPLYPLSYKHAFQRIHDDPLISSWGSKLYATPDSDFCAARDLGARYVLSAMQLNRHDLRLIRAGEINLYRIVC